MRILITGVTTDLGVRVAEHLLAAGHDVVGIGQRPHAGLDPGVEVSYGPLTGEQLGALTDAADAVIHLSPVERGVPESAGLMGLVHIAHAASRSGTRLLLPVHSGGDPELYAQAAELVSSSWGPTVIIRLAPLIGRIGDWAVSRTIATLLSTEHGTSAPIRLLHVDDLCRFLTRAVDSDRTGTVDLAGTDTVTYLSARRRLGEVRVRHHLPVWPVTDPVFRLVPLHRDWGFECGWEPSDAVADVALALAGHRLDEDGVPTAAVAAVTTGVPAAPVGLAGEFDDPIDPRFPVFSTAGSPDALPGPLTPVTLDVHLAGLRNAQRATARLLEPPAPVAAEWQARGTAVFGHRLYVGVSVTEAIRPGVSALHHSITMARGLGGRCVAYTTAVDAARRDSAAVAVLTESQIDARILFLRSLIGQGWALAATAATVQGVFNRLARRPGAVVAPPDALTCTGQLAGETAALAGWLRTDARLRELAAAGDLTAVRRASAGFGTAFDAAIRRVGHHGPGEAELANPVIADAPDQLLVAAALAAGDVVAGEAPGRSVDPLARRADAAGGCRELAWNSTALATHQLRITLREKGVRLFGRRDVEAAADVSYLTCAELVAPARPVRELVARRRAERLRLQAISLPETIVGGWLPVDAPEPPAPQVVALIAPEAPTAAAVPSATAGPI